jgi:hypothetical protein
MTDPVERSDTLDQKLAGVTGMDENVRHLMLSSRRNRLLIQVLGVSVAFDIVLSVGLGWVAFTANSAAARANSVQQQQRSTCLATKKARAAQVQLWTYILDLPPATPRTPAQEQQAEQFRLYITRSFAQRHC